MSIGAVGWRPPISMILGVIGPGDGTFWITASFIAGLIPAVALFIGYGLLTDWWKTFTGRVLFGLIATITVSYALSSFTLLWPGFWHGPGELTRVLIRFAVAAVLWGLWAVWVRARRAGRRSGQSVAVERR